ncbi:MAG: Unknown protein [uncultured Sulfurovum sp.]|uniref:Paraquat-inducible protein A n=1 Tax=uncultured Sulfurovum sp. TaxID=269237 RepID=A0A6S6TZR0_9BACT|nr:MAG: Unknown protein [uncultured Sulfurovum sp.]
MYKLMQPLKVFKTLLILILLIGMSYVGFMTYEEAKQYEDYTSKLASVGDANSLAHERIDELTEIISLGLVKNESKNALEQLRTKQSDAKTQSKQYLYYFILLLSILIIFTFTCTIRVAAMSLSAATFVSLIYGLINPILMVTIQKEIEYLGNVILSFESKGIIGSIIKLYESGELVVAFTILLFSILLPVAKSFTLTFMLIFHQSPWNKKLIAFFKHIGKWSMLDVFVVSTFLVYFTSDSGGISQAEIQVGLYFFLIYVILSMVTAILTLKLLEKFQSNETISPSLHPYDLKKL